MTKVLGLYFSPRESGNSDLLLDRFLEGVRDSGGSFQALYSRDLDIQGCVECGACDETGECILEDDMDDIYPLLAETELIVVSSPIFFYGVPAQAKALVDRSQALWNRMRLEPDLKRKNGKGFFLGVGATKGQNLFEGTILCIKYFYDAIGLPLTMDSLTYRLVEAKGAIEQHPTALQEAYEAGRSFAAK